MMGLFCNRYSQFPKRIWIVTSVLFFLFKSSFSYVIVNQNTSIRHWHNICPYYKPKRKKRVDSSLVVYSKDEEDDDDDDDDDEYIDIKDDDMKSFLEKNKNDVSFGIGKGRSAPSQRKAMGRSSSSSATVHVCTNCGSEFVQWLGKCPTCQQWNTIQPFQVNRSTAAENNNNNRKKKNSKARSWLEEDDNYDHDHFDDYEEDRTEYRPIEPVSLHDLLESTANNNYENYDERIVLRDDDEWNTVLGGGIVPGSLLLLGGEPGVGKSTLLLQVASQVVSSTINNKVLYVSGEETLYQIASRAKRLQIVHKRLQLISETNIGKITSHIKQQQNQEISENNISFVIIDSIQTMYDPNTKSVPGSVTQVRDCVAALLRLAKSRNIAILCIGHVTKSGTVAGPKTVEHMVDVVLNLERHKQDENEMKVLRAYKNRFGSTQQVGIYTTSTDDGKKNNGRLVPCPSSMILSSSSLKEYDVEGCVMTLIQQGIRSSFMELQILVLPLSSKGGGKRATVAGGIVPSRVLLLMAVLMKQLGCYPLLYSHVYVNLIGYSTTGTDKNNNNNLLDVAIMVAMVSSLTNIPIRADTCVYGQVGLLGELVGLPNNKSLLDQQMKEARQMGFSRIVTPPPKKMSGRWKKPQIRDLEWITCPTILDAIQACLIEPLPTYRYKNSSHQLRIHPSVWKKQKKQNNNDNNNNNNQNKAIKSEKIIIDDDDNNQDDTTFMTDYQIMMNMLKDNDKKTEHQFDQEESDETGDFYDDDDDDDDDETSDLDDDGNFE